MRAEISWVLNTIKVVLVDTALYTPNIATDVFLSSVPVGARIATSGALTGKTDVNAIADADDVILPFVVGATAEALVIYQDTGSDATSRLIAYIDSAVNLPITPDGNNLTIQWSDGAGKIFQL